MLHFHCCSCYRVSCWRQLYPAVSHSQRQKILTLDNSNACLLLCHILCNDEPEVINKGTDANHRQCHSRSYAESKKSSPQALISKRAEYAAAVQHMRVPRWLCESGLTPRAQPWIFRHSDTVQLSTKASKEYIVYLMNNTKQPGGTSSGTDRRVLWAPLVKGWVRHTVRAMTRANN